MKGKTIKAEMKNSYGSNIQSVKNFAEILLCNKLSISYTLNYITISL